MFNYPRPNDQHVIYKTGQMEIVAESSIPKYENVGCPYCSNKYTPVFIFVRNHVSIGEWICGSKECITFYVLRVL